ncbi:MAG: metallophosphoesterase [Ardenticatenaceae bacterium]
MKMAKISKPFLLCAMLIALFGGSFTFMLGQAEGVAQAAVEEQSSLIEEIEEIEEIKATASLTIPNGYKTGQWPTVPSTYTEHFDESYTWLLMEGEPNVTMSGANNNCNAEISFTTAISVPAVTVYYGIYDPLAVPPWPHFVTSIQENLEGESQTHQVSLSPSKLTPEMDAKGGGVIVYRIEMENVRPEKVSNISPLFLVPAPATRFYDERFEFYNCQLVPTVSEGPFVDQVTESSAIISWDTDRPVQSGTVKIGGVGNFSYQEAATSHFEITVTELTPGTTYTYTVEVSDGMTTTSTSEYFFRTPAENTTEFTFAVMGDSRGNYGGGERGFNGINAFTMRNLATSAFVKGAEFIVHTGDMVNGYTSSVLNFEMQLGSFKDSVEAVGHYIPIYEVMGNHEALIHQYQGPSGAFDVFQLDREGDESAEVIFGNQFVNPTNGPTPNNRAAQVPDGQSLPPYSENVYYFDYGNSRFVVMNNNYWWSSRPEQYGGNLEGYVLDDQMAWLTQLFSDTKSNSDIKHLFFFAQEPMFPNNGHTGDAMWYDKGQSPYPCFVDCLSDLDRSYIIERRDQIWKAFVGTGKAVAANFGDEHNYSRTLIVNDKDDQPFDEPVWQLISGGAGAPISFEQKEGLPWSANVEKFSTQFHYTLFQVDDQRVVLEVYSIDDELIESVVLKEDDGTISANARQIEPLEPTSSLVARTTEPSALSLPRSEIQAMAPLTIPDGYKTGLWPITSTIPSTYTEFFDEFYTWLLMEGEPEVNMTGQWEAQISFTTAISVPAVTVYYGIYDPLAVPSWSHFQNVAQEQLEGESTQHQVTLSHLNFTSEMEAKGGGVIVYRIEMQNIRPEPVSLPAAVLQPAPGARFYDQRFEFYNGQVAPTVSEGPFVDQITETRAIISWDTDRPVISGTVKLDGVGDFASQNGNSSHFEVALEGLTAGTTYTYTVEVSDGMSTTNTPEYFFRTPAENTTEFTFAVMGDSRGNYGGGERGFNGLNAFAMRNLSTDAFVKGADFIVHTGDMVNGYTSSVLNFEMQLESFKDSVEAVGHYIPIYEMMGNHEALIDQYISPGQGFDVFQLDKKGDESTEAIFANEFVNPTNGPTPDHQAAGVPDGQSLPPYSENVYYFDYGNSRFVVMNNNYWWSSRPEQYGGNLEGYVLDDQMAWLTQVFSDTKNNDNIEHLFFFAQEPMFPNDGHTIDAMWYSDGASTYPCNPTSNCLPDLNRSYIIERRDQIWDAFVGTGKAVAANFGDEHNYSRTLIVNDKDDQPFDRPVWQLISGGAGAPISFRQDMTVPWSDTVRLFRTEFHYTLFKVDGQQVMLEVYSIDGVLIDQVGLTVQTNEAPTAITVDGLNSTSASALAWQWMMAGLPLSILAGILIIRRRHKRRS